MGEPCTKQFRVDCAGAPNCTDFCGDAAEYQDYREREYRSLLQELVLTGYCQLGKTIGAITDDIHNGLVDEVYAIDLCNK